MPFSDAPNTQTCQLAAEWLPIPRTRCAAESPSVPQTRTLPAHSPPHHQAMLAEEVSTPHLPPCLTTPLYPSQELALSLPIWTQHKHHHNGQRVSIYINTHTHTQTSLQNTHQHCIHVHHLIFEISNYNNRQRAGLNILLDRFILILVTFISIFEENNTFIDWIRTFSGPRRVGLVVFP